MPDRSGGRNVTGLARACGATGLRIYNPEIINTPDGPVALSIRDPETDRLARELAALTGETMTQAIRTAIAERLERERGARRAEIERKKRGIEEIQRRVLALPVLDERSDDEILGYDEDGLPS
ncbi:MAG TPA: type II toxin-antitoxin system VapB family antitoxin [Geminicoccaceae bacterium]